MPQQEVALHYSSALLQGVSRTPQHLGALISAWRRCKSGIGRNIRLARSHSWRSPSCAATQLTHEIVICCLCTYELSSHLLFTTVDCCENCQISQ